ncbi:MAG: rod shape-determining protein RodA [Deferribacteres bacterium]|nr:rod shape-determining protein RodA [candidate division KSB1 bacterium]MCB9503340.1 rod shape-determining protein RodA [Deferribacteres bacterium]
MLWDKDDLKKADIVLLIAFSGLLVIGLLIIYSATHGENLDINQNFSKQAVWILIGWLLLALVTMLPFKVYHEMAFPAYIFSILLLIAVLFWGSGAGVKRWFAFGPFRFQPAEIAKIATLLFLAKYAADSKRNFKSFRDIAVAFAIVGLPTLLIMKQPDLGTALVFVAMVLPILFWAGLSLFTVFLLIAPIITLASAFTFFSFFIAMVFIIGVMVVSGRGPKVIIPNFILNIGVGIVTPILWNQLHNYQKSRILTFIGLEQDPRGLGYQVLQSKVAIGSGGMWGKGWMEGTQTQLRFLPEQHTDFIFSVLGEEFGFLGVLIVLVLFFLLLWRALNIAQSSKNVFASLVVIGASTIIAFHVIVNTGMTVGIMPVTGLPLPFLSYGGSSLLTSTLLVGLILNAGRRRFQYL